MVVDQVTPPGEFVTALTSLKGHDFRPEFHVTQIPPPTRIAPWSVALQAEINDSLDLDPDCYRGDAKFVVLYDPDGQLAWDGHFRIVVHARSPIDSHIGGDPLLGEVAWSWLGDALDEAGAAYHNLNGTVTRVFNETFGGLHLSDAKVDIELRASWSPNTPYLGEHLEAWAIFSATCAGLEPAAPGVTILHHKVAQI